MRLLIGILVIAGLIAWAVQGVTGRVQTAVEQRLSLLARLEGR